MQIKDLAVKRVLVREWGSGDVLPLNEQEILSLADQSVTEIEPGLFAAPHDPRSRFATLLVATRD